MPNQNHKSAQRLGLWGVVLFFVLGCARVSIDSQKPIKVDVTMRLDIYQHVADDAKAIEGLISGQGSEAEVAAAPKISLWDLGVAQAYAEDASGYPPEVLAAIDRRKARRPELVFWQRQGTIGENNQGFVEVRSVSVTKDVLTLVQQENKDRTMIYEYIAKKNGVSVEETGKIFSKQIQQDVEPGTPVEVLDPYGKSTWVRK